MANKKYYLPNLCRNSNVLITLIVVECWVVVLGFYNYKSTTLASIGMLSLYLNWVVLGSIALLCILKARLIKLNNAFGFASALVLIYCVFCFVEIISQTFVISPAKEFDYDRFISYSLVTLIVSALVLRCFYFIEKLEMRNEAASNARLLALQSRIQPHFLFNSLNTISELTVTDPNQAELAINSLSMLFRASLENEKKQHSLEKEFTLCARYVDLERWRLGDNLILEWTQFIAEPSKWKIPKLLIQPLIENAIVHGRQANGLVNLSVDVRESTRHISIMVENTIGEDCVHNVGGNGIALDNIRERLQVLFDDQHQFRMKESPNKYTVLVRLPKQVNN